MLKLPHDLKTHSSVLSVNEVRKLCAPLMRHFDINLFYFIKSYYQGSQKGQRILLASDANWVQDYFDSRHYETELASFPGVLEGKTFVLSIWDGCHSNHASCKMGLLAQNKYQVAQLFYLTWVYDDYLEVYCFGIKKGHDHIPQQLLFNLDIFQHFCHYFNDAGQPLLQKAQQDAFTVPVQDAHQYSNPHYFEIKTHKHHLLDKMPIQRIYLTGKYQHIYLSPDEAKTLILACQALQYADIAKLLNVSVPTIKYRINSIRKKCNVKNKLALIRLFIEEGFVSHLKEAIN